MFNRFAYPISFLILLIIDSCQCETTLNATESSDQSTKSSNVTITDSKDTSTESSWRPVKTGSQYASQSGDKIYSVDLATFHKYRRNGMDNPSISNRVNDGYRRNYYPSGPERNLFDNEIHQYHRERPRYQEEMYPVRIQSCSHYLRDVNRHQYDGSSNYGVLQGWLGGMLPNIPWRGNPDDDKQHQLTSSYITTATPKVPTKYQHDKNYSGNKNYQQSTGYDRGSQVPVKSRQYNLDNRNHESHGRDQYSDFRHQDYDEVRNEQQGWTTPSHRDKNQRIIYYEYNLDDIRKPNAFQNQYHHHQHHDSYCNLNPQYGFSPCQQEVFINHRPPIRNQYDDGYSQNQQFTKPTFSSLSRTLSVGRDDNTVTPDPEYSSDEQQSHPNNPHPYAHRFLPNQEGKKQGLGYGYVYSLDLPKERQMIPGSAPSIYMTHFPFANNQHILDYDKYQIKKSTYSPNPYKKL